MEGRSSGWAVCLDAAHPRAWESLAARDRGVRCPGVARGALAGMMLGLVLARNGVVDRFLWPVRYPIRDSAYTGIACASVREEPRNLPAATAKGGCRGRHFLHELGVRLRCRRHRRSHRT